MIMKRRIISPLCSAVIIPGLGQILNQHLKKGLIILGIVFLLFIAGTVKLALIINSIFEGRRIERLDSNVVIQKIQGENFAVIWLLVIAFGIVWLYSILDAFLEGRKIDSSIKGNLK